MNPKDNSLILALIGQLNQHAMLLKLLVGNLTEEQRAGMLEQLAVGVETVAQHAAEAQAKSIPTSELN